MFFLILPLSLILTIIGWILLSLFIVACINSFGEFLARNGKIVIFLIISIFVGSIIFISLSSIQQAKQNEYERKRNLFEEKYNQTVTKYKPNKVTLKITSHKIENCLDTSYLKFELKNNSNKNIKEFNGTISFFDKNNRKIKDVIIDNNVYNPKRHPHLDPYSQFAQSDYDVIKPNQSLKNEIMFASNTDNESGWFSLPCNQNLNYTVQMNMKNYSYKFKNNYINYTDGTTEHFDYQERKYPNLKFSDIK